MPVGTDENGAFHVDAGARCIQSNASANVGVDYLRVSAPGFGVALVDTCSRAPWADPFRLRPGATVTGTLKGAETGHWVCAVVRADEL